MSDSLWLSELQHPRLPRPSISPGVCSNSGPLNRWCYLTVSSLAALFSFCLQSFPASESFPMSRLFARESSWLKSQAGHTFSQRNREPNDPQALNPLALAPFSAPIPLSHHFGVPTCIPIRLNAVMLLFCYTPTGCRTKPKLIGVSQAAASLSFSLLHLPVSSWPVFRPQTPLSQPFLRQIFFCQITNLSQGNFSIKDKRIGWFTSHKP